MGQVCLDSDVLIEFFKGNEGLKTEIEKFEDIYITSLSIFEFGKGKETMEQVKELKIFNILELNSSDLFKAVEIYKDLIKKGEIIDDNDIIIGTICINNNISLLTLNKKHFEKLKKFRLKLV